MSASADALGLSREQRVDKPWVALAHDVQAGDTVGSARDIDSRTGVSSADDVQAVATVRSGHDADAGSPVRGPMTEMRARLGRCPDVLARVSRLPNGCGAAVRVLGRSSMIASTTIAASANEQGAGRSPR